MKTAKLLPILLILLPVILGSVTRTVKQDGTGDYMLIQAALDASLSGDTVLVYPGRYYENLVIGTSNITLRSLEATTGNPVYIDSTIVDGMMMNPCLRVGQAVTDAFIRGFSFTNGLSIGSGGGAVLRSGSSSVITNTKIFGNSAGFGGGIKSNGSSLTLSGVSIYGNYALYSGGGFGASAASGYTNTITFDPVNRCSIYNNRAGVGQDIYIQNAVSDLNVYLDTFSVAEPSSYYAIYRPDGLDEYQIHFDILNAHHQEIDSDLYVSPEGDDTNDGLSAGSPLRSINEAIYRIASNPTHNRSVILAAGSYSRAANGQSFPIALKTHTVVQGSGMDNTSVIGDPHPLIPIAYGGTDNVFVAMAQPVISLASLSITTQNTNNDTCILVDSSQSLNLSNIHIHGVNPNRAASIFVRLNGVEESVWEGVLIENITTSDRGIVDVGQATMDGAMSGKISNCTFRNASSTYTSSSVWANPLIQIITDRDLTIENCDFNNLTMADDNSKAIIVAGVQYPQQNNVITLNNCLFRNITTHNDMISIASANQPEININNCTFAGNVGSAYAMQVKGNVAIKNSIFYNDTPYQIKIIPPVDSENLTILSIDHSLIRDGYNGIQQAAGNTVNYSTSNLDTAPLFSGGANIHDPLYYTLSAASPCIDSGTPDISGLDLPAYDLAGNWRVWNGRIDMGCYEYDSEPWVSNDDPVIPAIQESYITAYPNPFRAYTTVKVNALSGLVNQSKGVSDARITIYNIKGQRVKTINLDPVSSGELVTYWDGRDDDYAKCTSGIYILNLIVNGMNTGSGKVTLVR